MTQTSKKCYKWIVEDRFDAFHRYFLISVTAFDAYNENKVSEEFSLTSQCHILKLYLLRQGKGGAGIRPFQHPNAVGGCGN